MYGTYVFMYVRYVMCVWHVWRLSNVCMPIMWIFMYARMSLMLIKYVCYVVYACYYMYDCYVMYVCQVCK